MPKGFQKAMDNTLSNIPSVICFLDDILIVKKGSVSDQNLITYLKDYMKQVSP